MPTKYNYKARREHLEADLDRRFKDQPKYYASIQKWKEMEAAERFKAGAHNED